MSISRSLRTAVLFSCAALPVFAQTDASYRDNPEFKKHFEAAQLAAKRSDSMDRAMSEYEKASKIAGDQCIECLEKIGNIAMKTGDFKKSIRMDEAIEASPASTDKAKAEAKLHRVLAMMRKDGQKAKPATLAVSDIALTEAEKLQPEEAGYRYQRGRVLAMLERKDEASAEFRMYLKLAPPRDALRTRVLKFAEDPSLALRPMAPPFSLTTLDGKRFNLDAMGGRVVLIDFWATWCGPCNEELPHMKRLAKQFESEPFVLLSVSWDSDAEKWKAFIAKEGMTWSQFRDSTHQLSTVFGINAIPHYFTIDSDGVLQAENVGSGADIDGRIRKLVAKAKKDMAAAAKATDAGE